MLLRITLHIPQKIVFKLPNFFTISIVIYTHTFMNQGIIGISDICTWFKYIFQMTLIGYNSPGARLLSLATNDLSGDWVRNKFFS